MGNCCSQSCQKSPWNRTFCLFVESKQHSAFVCGEGPCHPCCPLLGGYCCHDVIRIVGHRARRVNSASRRQSQHATNAVLHVLL